ncbi:tetratricopeptide repeat protein [Pseudomonas sp. sp1636]|uniref:tetratricopeptide repeat protein n=1 Tax=Pseudomonas sp. sp1636 TaxID=3036707 RepID=UPI0025A5AF5F|nr:tetratricopeptide repeat protein [Pseudomonas sp. sp1636]MDM8351123.1 tetratricopeptide repeat protein [Pseudomonas sp. sp1636]
MKGTKRRIGIGWTLGAPGDEGCYALNVALQLARRSISATLLDVAEHLELEPMHRHVLAPALEEYAVSRDSVARHKGRQLPFPVWHPLGDRLEAGAGVVDTPGSPDIAIAAFQQVDFPAQNLQRAADMALIVTGSLWGAQVLRDNGLSHVLRCPPSVDHGIFHPAPRSDLFARRFVVYSGAELAYSKGQDIVIAAFRAFRQRHPEAVLICDWAPSAPMRLHELALSPHLQTLPEVVNGALQLLPWLAQHGIPSEAVIAPGPMMPGQLASLLRECDLAVFPSRCEATAGIAAMQAMACGVPCIVAGNTGHLDLLGDHLYVLKDQREVASLAQTPGKLGWGESTVEELLETMERAYRRRSEADGKGKAAVQFLQVWGWDQQVQRLLSATDQALAGVTVSPPGPDERYAWGLSLHRAGRFEEAERVYDEVLRRVPDHVDARGDRGNARRDRGDLDGAEADFRAILAVRPGYARALQSLGLLLRRNERLDEAIACQLQALASAPTPSLQWDLAFSLLLQGRYAEAWPHFEHRHLALGLRTADPAKPKWDGQPVIGSTLLVLDEQGLGDTLQFLRFLLLIPLGPGGRVIFAGKPTTLSVVRRLLPATDVYRWDQPLPRSQAWVPLMTLPARLGVMRPEDIPVPISVPLAEPERVARWRPSVRGDDERPVVGICWRGNPDFSGDAQRSPGLAALQPLLAIEGVRFISLQVGEGRQEIASLGLEQRLVDIGAAIEAEGIDVLDSLAALHSCDLVVSSCTSVAHMAGLIGRPTWVLLAGRPDWRWMLGRRDSPWYPSLRLIRQGVSDSWRDVAQRTAVQLAAWRDRQATLVLD